MLRVSGTEREVLRVSGTERDRQSEKELID